MRRRHREIASGEVAMMAVITKAMGAFLVLMILLLPYYTGDTKSQQTVDETKQRIDAAKAGLDGAVDKLKKGRLTDAEIDDLLKSLILARDELVEAQNLITQLRIKIDQMASQINRLEQQNTALQDQVAQLQGELFALKAAVATLVAENLALKATVADLTAKVSALEAANAKLTQEKADLQAEIDRLKAFDPETLKARIKELEKKLEELTAENTDLRTTLVAFGEKITTLENEITELKKIAQIDPYLYVVSDCSDPDLPVHTLMIDGTQGDDAFDDAYVAELMPWARPRRPLGMGSLAKSDARRFEISGDSIPISKGTLTWDIFLSMNLDVETDSSFFSFEAVQSPKDSSGNIISSEKLPSCTATMFVGWQGKVANLGTYKLGRVEPIIHVKHIDFGKDETSVSEAKDQRPEMPRHVANAVCAHYKNLCTLAKRHAEWRIQGENPWLREADDPAASPKSTTPPPDAEKITQPEPRPVFVPFPTNDGTVSPAPESQKTDPLSPKPGPPPPPTGDKTIKSSP